MLNQHAAVKFGLCSKPHFWSTLRKVTPWPLLTSFRGSCFANVKAGHSTMVLRQESPKSAHFFKQKNDRKPIHKRRFYKLNWEVPQGKSNFLLKHLQCPVSLAPQLRQVRVDSVPSMVWVKRTLSKRGCPHPDLSQIWIIAQSVSSLGFLQRLPRRVGWHCSWPQKLGGTWQQLGRIPEFSSTKNDW